MRAERSRAGPHPWATPRRPTTRTPTACSHRERTAFTLVELIVTILIIGILASIAVVGYTQYADRAQVASTQADMSALATATLAQATLAGTQTITVNTVRAALEQQFAADVTVTAGVGASGTPWTLLPSTVTPTGPHEISVGFTNDAGTAQVGSGTRVVLVALASPTSGTLVMSSTSATTGGTCSQSILGAQPAGFNASAMTCAPLDLHVDNPVCATGDADSAYWQGYDTATWHKSAGMAYDPSIPAYFTFPAECDADFVHGYNDSWSK